MNTKRILTIARWEYLQKVRSKGFLISLILTPLIVVGSSNSSNSSNSATASTICPMSCPAANASGSPSPAPWRSTLP